jgi:N-acetylglucosamine kinase-like BadF-type ATPase
MKLIAESGATKAVWILIDSGLEIKRFHTEGIRPGITHEMKIRAIIVEVDLFFKKDVFSELLFFGSGCFNEERALFIQNLLSEVVQNKCKISVKSDLEAAALGVWKDKSGVVGIMGTGSIAFFWNGNSVEQICGGLGFKDGDEGGGSDLGKRLIQQLVIEKNDLTEMLEAEIGNLNKFSEKAMLSDNPAREFGQLTYFMLKNRLHKTVQIILKEAFESYLETIEPLKSQGNEIRLVGSIANIFRNEITKGLETNSWKPTCILQHPIEKIIHFV